MTEDLDAAENVFLCTIVYFYMIIYATVYGWRICGTFYSMFFMQKCLNSNDLHDCAGR